MDASSAGIREDGLSFRHAASFRSNDFDTLSLPLTANENESGSTCRNCSHAHACATFTCPVCGTYNALHHERIVVSSRDGGDGTGQKSPREAEHTKDNKKDKKSSRNKSLTKSRSRKSKELLKSSSRYMALSDLGDGEVEPSNNLYPSSPITPAPRRRSMHRDEHGMLSTTPIRTQIRILVPTKSEADLPPTRSPVYSGSSTRTMESNYRRSLSPIRRGFRGRDDMEGAVATKDGRAYQREERCSMGGTHPANTIRVNQASECRTSVPVPCDSLQTHLPKQTTIDSIVPRLALTDNVTEWSEAERHLPWECRTCTFVNENPLHLSCSICGVLREIGICAAVTTASAFEEQMTFLRGDTQQATVQSKSKKVEEVWFAKLQAQRIQEMVELQEHVLRNIRQSENWYHQRA